jgi:hypothetical protein
MEGALIASCLSANIQADGADALIFTMKGELANTSPGALVPLGL